MKPVDPEYVRCPTYIFAARAGAQCGCGRMRGQVFSGGSSFGRFVCRDCGLFFTQLDLDWDRRLSSDPARRIAEDARIRDGRYIS
jgi:hypothetical protein